MNYIIRRAELNDIGQIMAMGRDPAFAMSDSIRFYDREELVEWIETDQFRQMLYVIYDPDNDTKLLGFYFCKLISSSWAMLDNFYVISGARENGLGKAMMEHLKEDLREKKVPYLMCLVDVSQNAGAALFITRNGFKTRRTFTWFDQEL